MVELIEVSSCGQGGNSGKETLEVVITIMSCFIYILDSSNSSTITFLSSSSRYNWNGIWAGSSNGSWTRSKLNWWTIFSFQHCKRDECKSYIPFDVKTTTKSYEMMLKSFLMSHLKMTKDKNPYSRFGLTWRYLQPYYCNGVFADVYLSAGQH